MSAERTNWAPTTKRQRSRPTNETERKKSIPTTTIKSTTRVAEKTSRAYIQTSETLRCHAIRPLYIRECICTYVYAWCMWLLASIVLSWLDEVFYRNCVVYMSVYAALYMTMFVIVRNARVSITLRTKCKMLGRGIIFFNSFIAHKQRRSNMCVLFSCFFLHFIRVFFIAVCFFVWKTKTTCIESKAKSTDSL